MSTRSPAFVVGAIEDATKPHLSGYADWASMIERFGGTVRLAGTVTALEGDGPGTAIVIEFPDAVAAAAWYDAAGHHPTLTAGRVSARPIWLIEANGDGSRA